MPRGGCGGQDGFEIPFHCRTICMGQESNSFDVRIFGNASREGGTSSGTDQ